MMSNFSKHLGVENYEIFYTIKEKVVSFRKGINLSGSGDKEEVILKSFFEEKQVNLVALTGLSNEFIYKHLLVVHSLVMLIPFTIFKSEVLTTINVASYRTSPSR